MDEADQRKDRILVVVLLLALVALVGLIVFGFYVLSTRFASAIRQSASVAESGRYALGPDIAVPLSGTSGDVVVARLTLPDVPKNRHWFADSVYIVDEKDTQKYVEIGLMRRPEVDRRLRAYIGYKGPGRSLDYRDFAIGEGPHSLAISRSGDRFTFQIDGEQRPEQAAIAMALPYAQVAAQISSRGDTPSGIVTQVLAGPHGGLAVIDLSDACRYDNHGLVFVDRDNGLVASGAFAQSLPGVYRGDCSAFDRPKSMMQRAKG